MLKCIHVETFQPPVKFSWCNPIYFKLRNVNNILLHRITILDVNDEPPVFSPLPESCVMVTEFHEPGETIYTLKATDADDPNLPNGWVTFSILAGNDEGSLQHTCQALI